MRSLLFTLLFFVSSLAISQWNIVYNDPSKDLVDIQFTSPNVGYVAGDNGSNAFLLKTTDGGLTWTENTLPLSFVHKICFLNDTLGYLIAGGAPVKLLKTVNGGASWTGHQLDTSYAVMGFDMFDASTGFYMNNGGRLRQILSGGSTYAYSADTCYGNDIELTSASTGYISGSNYLLKTTNSGVSWSTLSTGLTDYIYSNTLTFADDSKGYFSTRDGSGNGQLYYTPDGAMSWTAVHAFAAASMHSKNNVCMAISDTGKIVCSHNYGLTWNDESLPVMYMGIEKFVCYVNDDNEGFVINGFAGQIFKRSGTLAVHETAQDNLLHVKAYPNPTSNDLFVDAGSETILNTTLIDHSGRVVLNLPYTNHLNLQNLAPGVYYLRVTVRAQTQTIKIFKS